MRRRDLRRLVAVAAALCAPATPCLAAADFAITHVAVPKPTATANQYLCLVTVAGETPPRHVLEAVTSWRLTARAGKLAPLAVSIDSVWWDSTSNHVTLRFSAAPLTDPRKYAWKALFTGNDLNLLAVSDEAPAGKLQTAKGKDDADLYAAGSLLAGRGSAPVYSLDMKLRWTREVDYTPWDLGASVAATINSDAKLPKGTSPFDLNATSAALGVRYWLPERARLVIDMQPVRAEFTKDLGTGTVVGAGRMVLVPPPIGTWGVYPFVGVELGAPVVKPDSLFDRPVDLRDWHRSTRLVVGVTSALYLFQPAPTPDDLHRLSVSGSFTAREPFSDEPYVTTEIVDKKPVSTVQLQDDLRPYAEAALVYNVNKLLGIQVQYKYGSLPPVFKLADHQVSVGLTLKAKYATARPAAF